MSASPPDWLCGPEYGALFFSTLMASILYGITCMQTFFYYTHYPNDPSRIKIFVAAICTFNTIQEALTISGAYKYIMAGLESQLLRKNGIPDLVLQTLFTAMVATPTQGFFIYRIYVFSGKNLAVPLVWIPLAVYQLVSPIVCITKALYAAESIHVSKLDDGFLMDIAISCLSVAAVVDILTTVCLTILLIRKRNTTGYSSTAHVLQRLAIFAIKTGIWTTIFALLSLVLLRIYPSNLLYAVFGIPLSSVYCNTLLANLNVRRHIRDEMTCEVDLQADDGHETSAQNGRKDLVHMSEPNKNCDVPGRQPVLEVGERVNEK